MKLKDYYIKDEINTKKYKVWNDTLPKTRMLVPYEICEGLGVINEFKMPSAIFDYVMNAYEVLKGDPPITAYRSLFVMKKHTHLYIKDTEEGCNGFVTEDELYNIYSIYDMEIDYKKYPIIGYPFKYPGTVKMKKNSIQHFKILMDIN